MDQNLNPRLHQFLADIDGLVKAKNEATVRRLQQRIEETIKQTSADCQRGLQAAGSASQSIAARSRETDD